MAFRYWQGILAVILTNMLLHMFIFYSNSALTLTIGFIPSMFILFNATMAITHLFFPIFGFLGDYYITRYYILIIGMILIIISTIVGTVLIVLDHFYPSNIQGQTHFWAIVVPIIVLSIGGYGIIFSNILQFGIDQLLFNISKGSLRMMVRWYYWALFIGQQVLFYVFIAMFVGGVFPNQSYQSNNYNETGGSSMFISVCLSLLFSIFVFVVLVALKKKFIIRPTTKNGLKSLAKLTKIIKYAIKHKIKHRGEVEGSIFLDVGKNTNGGPFTEVDVEKAKNFVNLLCIILTLVSFQLSGDTYSLSERLINFRPPTGDVHPCHHQCPSLEALLLIGINPNNVPNMIIIVLVPILQIMRCIGCKKRCTIVTKILLGTITAAMSLISQLLIGAFITMSQKYVHCHNGQVSQLVQTCFEIRLNLNLSYNETLSFMNTMNATNTQYWYILIPQTLSGLAYVLVAMITLELICTQSYADYKGTLLGTWYMTYSARYLIGVMDAYIVNGNAWYMLKGVQLLTVIALIIFFSYFIQNFRYHSGNELMDATTHSVRYDQNQSEVTTPIVHRVARNQGNERRGYGTILRL